jgi:hypothetical protein
MRPGDLESVVKIHNLRFPNHRSTKLGRAFLCQMYRWFLLYHPAFCQVADKDGQVVGFIVGSIGGYGRQVFRFALPQIAWSLSLRPQLLFSRSTYFLWQSYLRALLPARKLEKRTSPPAHLRLCLASMAVTESAGAAGVYLIAEMEKFARQNRVQIITHTVQTDNPKVIRLYSKLGWTIDGQTADSVHFLKTL